MSLRKKYLKKTAIVLSIIIAFVSCTKKDIFDQRKGFVYTMSNDLKRNSLLCYAQQADGSLSYQSRTSSGGAGNGAGLGSQGSIIINAAHQWLYAVNAGSNSVSSFRIGANGNLTLAHTISSNGTFPVSVTVHGNWLYVVNSATSNISGYVLGSGGTMTDIPGSIQPLSSGSAGPAQISFTPDGKKLIVTEKMTNKITMYLVNAMGIAGRSTSQPSAGQTPFGFYFSGNDYIVVAEASGGMANASTVSSYSVAGTTTVVSGPIAAQQTSACWTTVSHDGQYAFVTNTGSNSISSFKVNNNGQLELTDATAATTGMTPVDITFSGNERYIYNLNSGSHSITQYRRSEHEPLKKIGELSGIPEHAAGIASLWRY